MSGKYVTETLEADESGVARATALLRDGGLVALPTETVYGLAARADNADAVARIYAAKGRPSFNPLIVHVASLEQAEALARFSPAALELAEKHWPGPLTLVLPRREDAGLAEAVTAGLDTVAIRVPAHPVMRRVLGATELPLAAPSANRSGFISPTRATHVLVSLSGRIEAVLDGGECRAGIESTIVAVRGYDRLEVLRPGPVDVGLRVITASEKTIEAPGQLASHYSPGKPMRLGVTQPDNDEFFIGFADLAGDRSLSLQGDMEEAASRLYACLHEAALSKKLRIAVAPIPEKGIGSAINDRLKRAATPAEM